MIGPRSQANPAVASATGSGADGWRPGDGVYGLVGFDRPGAAAEYVTAPAADLARKPASVDHLAAAAVPLGALTAWQALHEHARVTATASARDRDFVTGLGADEVLDYSGRFEDHVRDVDVVVDLVGGTTTERSWQVLRSGGILVDIAEEPEQAKGAATMSAACSSWSAPTAVSWANWPA